MRWLSPRDIEVPEGIRLFCFPHAGAGAAGFYRWKRLLPPRIAVCPVLLPGREARFAETPLLSVADVVDQLMPELLSALDRPFALYGHSMGSLLAYECAVRLAQVGGPAPRLLCVSGRNAPDISTGAGKLHKLGDAALIEALRGRYGAHSAAVLEDAELRKLFLPVVRADLQVVESYVPAWHGLLTCNIAAFAGEDDRSVTSEGLHAWAQRTEGEFQTRRMAGDHFFHLGSGQTELLQALADRLLQV